MRRRGFDNVTIVFMRSFRPSAVKEKHQDQKLRKLNEQ